MSSSKLNSSKLILNGAGWYIFTIRPLFPEERDPRIYFATSRPLTLWAWRSYLITKKDNVADSNYKPLE